MCHGADVQQEGQAHGEHLEQLPVERVRPPEMQLGVAAGGAGEPGQRSCGWKVQLKGATLSVHTLKTHSVVCFMSQN